LENAKKRVVIIGAGPAGLTAASELADAGFEEIVVLEASEEIGGLARSVNYRGNRIDIGGHRFFSKSDWVTQWWLRVLPLAASGANEALQIAYQGRSRAVTGAPTASERDERVMLVRQRLSRIYFAGKFFDYPLKANLDTARKLGLRRCLSFAASYAWARLFPRRPEKNLEDFFINRFGRRLYERFFRDYTEKVWGVPCAQISAEWGAQRVKSLSIAKALRHALLKPFRRGGAQAEQTSLIERFLYPKLGPGLMWESVAADLRVRGVRIELGAKATRIEHDGQRVTAVRALGRGGESRHGADAVISTMPVRDLVLGLEPAAPAGPREIAAGLQYRDFLIVGLLYRRLRDPIPDNWIYIQEPGVRVGRLQIFNNWSPYLVRDPATVWIGMEYFCSEGDALWQLPDEEMVRLAVEEMRVLRLADPADRLDAVVVRAPKAYPGYFGSFSRFGELRSYLDRFANLYLVGRNGMHRYNNQDHSMLSARLAVEAIATGNEDKSALWAVNIDDEYHEEKTA
jgi:protoporphyrinogen oxidase